MSVLLCYMVCELNMYYLCLWWLLLNSVGIACGAAADQAEACMCLGAHHHQTDWSFALVDS